jgi:hypothetical protein
MHWRFYYSFASHQPLPLSATAVGIEESSQKVSWVLFASSVVSVAFRFRPVLPFSRALPMVLFTLFYPHKHPLGFLIDTSTEQGLNRQLRHQHASLPRASHMSHRKLITISPKKGISTLLALSFLRSFLLQVGTFLRMAASLFACLRVYT